MEEKKNNLIKIARSLLGTPYKYAVSTDEIPKFLDCSSFTQYILKQIGTELPRSAILQATIGKKIAIKELQTGDLIFYHGTKGHYNDELFGGKKIYIGHVSMYMENGKAIHATAKNGVIEEVLENILIGREPIMMIKRVL